MGVVSERISKLGIVLPSNAPASGNYVAHRLVGSFSLSQDRSRVSTVSSISSAWWGRTSRLKTAIKPLVFAL